MAQSIADLYVLYRIVKDISTPFKETKAFKLGLIDEKGKRLKKAESPEEKDAMSYYDRFVFNIKRIMSKANLDSQLASYAGALFLIKEQDNLNLSDDQILNGIVENINYLNAYKSKSYTSIIENGIANVTGPQVPGTGDDPAHWKKKGRPRVNGKYINGVTFLRRMNKKYSKSDNNG